MFATSNQVSILSVTKLNRFAKRVLESEIGLVWVTGEISNFVSASSGHWYFTLKDKQAQVRSAMFKGANQSVNFRPKQGDKVLVRASIGLYEPRGDYQLIVQHMEPEGVGQLKQQFEALKQALSEQGLFNNEHKQALPQITKKIGVVTSPTGAAIHDILHVLQRRNPTLEVILYPAAVQGDLAAQEIVKQIQVANRRKEVDLLIVGRGGGSLEDLWPFNEEIVARAIFESSLPVVSAVGHEIDVTIADFVADLRAPTPSVAAEIVSADLQVIQHNLNQLLKRLQKTIQDRKAHDVNRIDGLFHRLKTQSPMRLIQQQTQGLDRLNQRLENSHPHAAIQSQKASVELLSQRMQRALLAKIANKKQAFDLTKHKIESLSPVENIASLQGLIAQQQKNLFTTIQARVNEAKQLLANQSAILDSVSPLSTLARGYSITYEEKNDNIIRSINDVQEGQCIRTHLKDGDFLAKVTIKK
ncbi:exodeoxyribonuclease VII large subunit [Agaribacter flavus]|uniref:Exodeoxyribonuclease 7 large subunit n=1 Tax=Agaribacter flavus TaxID=1902781 RepID=A0ABV7FSE3_9ALTE